MNDTEPLLNVDRLLQSIAATVEAEALANVVVIVGLPGHTITGVIANTDAFLESVRLSGIVTLPAFAALWDEIQHSAEEEDSPMQDALTLVQPRSVGATLDLPAVIRIPWPAVCWWALVSSPEPA